VQVYLIPSVAGARGTQLRDYAWDLDGLILQGGDDVAPESYGEKPLKPEWSGDAVRDRYELELAKEFLACNKPVLGICRGAQLLNVLFGGTLYQDLPTQFSSPTPGRAPGQAKASVNHRDWDLYDGNHHELCFEAGSHLSKWYPVAAGVAKVNSIHHQGVKSLGKGLVAEARSPDGLIEAIRLEDDEPFAFGVQWHPEFHTTSSDKSLLDGEPLLRQFLNVAKEQRA
jgi:putative glutamine amidotransferase